MITAQHQAITRSRKLPSSGIHSQLECDRLVLWLDYASPGRGAQLVEFTQALSLCDPGDVVRITLNANVESLDGSSPPLEYERKLQERLDNLKADLGKCFPSTAQPCDMAGTTFKYVLMRAVQMAAIDAIGGAPGLQVLPLHSCHYDDGQPMLTVTAVLCDPYEHERVLGIIRGSRWKYWATDWGDVHEIFVPTLSTRERLHLDQQIFLHDPDTVHQNLTFQLAKSVSASKRALQAYVEHYARYPKFVRVDE